MKKLLLLMLVVWALQSIPVGCQKLQGIRVPDIRTERSCCYDDEKSMPDDPDDEEDNSGSEEGN